MELEIVDKKSFSKVIKIIWTISMVISLTSCSYLIIKNLFYYYEYNIVTNINVVYEIPSKFPAVSICQQNIDYSPSSRFLSNKNIIKCKFNLKDCAVSNFTLFYDPYYGNCFKFNGNSKRLLHSKEAGKFYAFQMEMFFDSSHFNGLHLYIHNQSINPSPVEGIDVSNGFETNIILNRILDSKVSYYLILIQPIDFCLISYYLNIVAGSSVQ